MPIYTPGIRSKGRHVQTTKRDVVAVLQLTAMVDMFTVLVVFLLQNYAVTNQILPISEKIELPQAKEVKELKPSHVVVLSEGIVSLNEEELGSLEDETTDTEWVFSPLREKMEELLQISEQGGSNFLLAQFKKMNQSDESESIIKQAPFRVTIQADENTQFLDLKKVMYTLTDAGVREMNFAVIKTPDLDFNNN